MTPQTKVRKMRTIKSDGKRTVKAKARSIDRRRQRYQQS